MDNKNAEKIRIYTKQSRKDCKAENNEQKILSDLKEIDFCSNVEKCDKDDLLNKIVVYFENKGYFFLFISLLKTDFYEKFLDTLKEQCSLFEDEKFLTDFSVILNGIVQGKLNAKEHLFSSENVAFSDASFYCHYEKYSNLHGSLNINFTEQTQCLCINTVLKEETNTFTTSKCKTKKIILYDNGYKSVIIETNADEENYLFSSDSSCQFEIIRFVENNSYTILLDIISGEIINVELKVNDKNNDPQKSLNLIASNERILIKRQKLSEVLVAFFKDREPEVYHIRVQNECMPIKSWKDLKNWKPPSVKHTTAPLRKRSKHANDIKTLVCHDMKGGYLEDRFINGTTEENCFFFVHWAAVDIFGYFSHHLVSIPPCSWISAAHTNGVQVIGTFITEWDEGVQVFEDVFSDKNLVHALCMQLVNIAVCYGFEGWLINIENEVKPCQIPLLKYFVKSLTATMHAYIPGALVIWYDSVLKNGDLSWQSCLMDLNRLFFLDSDGIFLNYNWDEEKLLHSKLQASDRCTDVYVGVDVFGRGKCFTDGGFSTDISVKEVRKHGLSIGLFAPGWVYECLDVKNFRENQFKFWGALQELIPPRIVEGLPYCTSFCPGFGNKMFRNGKVISDEPWHNMNLQQPQPVYFSSAENHVTLYSDDAFNGGGCLCLSGNMKGKHLELSILKASFCLENTCIINYAYKPLVQDVDVGLCLDMLSSSDVSQTYKVYLVDSEEKHYASSNLYVKYLTPAPTDQVLKTGYKIDDESFEQQTWIKRLYLLNSDDFNYHSIQNISVVLSSKTPLDQPVSVLLGELEILPVCPTYNLVYEDLKYKYIPDGPPMIDVECVLKWQFHSSIFCSDIYLQAANEKRQFVCTTNQFFYQLKCNISLTPEITIILCPKTAGSEKLPVASVKIQLKL